MESIHILGIEPGVGLLREIRKHTPERVRLAIAAFEQYRSTTVINMPGKCLKSMIQDEAVPNVPQQPTKSKEQEFDEWYAKAIQQGFVLDLPKNYLGVVGGEIHVKVKEFNTLGGYINMAWREARKLMLDSGL